MKSLMKPLLVGLASLQFVSSIQLSVNSTASIKSTASTIAYGIMSYYTTNRTGIPPTQVGTLPPPLYWWEAGAVWGGLVDYWMYTNDSTYNPTVTQALLAQVGPDNNYMPPAYFASLGNDDQAFWGLAVLSAAEYGFAVPSGNASTLWSDLAAAVFNTQWPRWDNTTCNGGLKWQIFQSNAGYDYKNSISNGGFFQIAARLGRYTGNQTYVEWAEKAWDWMEGVGLIDADYNVFDGADDHKNCSDPNKQIWSYNPAMMLYGTAMMYNATNGSEIWQNRTTGLMKAITNTLFSPFPNATNIMYERTCEPTNTCDNDQYSFKAYLSRSMAKSVVVAPYLASPVTSLLTRSAQAAAQSCSGGRDNVTCGQKWYVGGWDGSYGIGQQLSALEVVQSLLVLRNPSKFNPQTIKDVPQPSGTLPDPPSPTQAAVESTTSGSSGANTGRRVSVNSMQFWVTMALPFAVTMAFGGSLGLFR